MLELLVRLFVAGGLMVGSAQFQSLVNPQPAFLDMPRDVDGARSRPTLGVDAANAYLA
ncbi:hypothetical protein [Methylobacterium gnaphalii]|uniref:Uncharacterized protein n=1 Tax=Methylobacterium gnaphalii TaxID=1010610 RepID=A0A512JQC3_9HYPH|nr:hypothetical protein [Methylobacterium gnaphalii]GEP12149.1 hypothetical protein MGN01_39940 [Methylobacterium gnaphalii]GJD70013.1 hypothetical protein MMMDOFMJ_2953 [Methylobacterium gnaphalii]GLS48908.1 hypothetical protein GCM10007885_17550 [Methylobacterium gnaphalii]